MKKLAILGASGHGKVVADIAECCGWQKIVFFDDAWPDIQQNGAWQVVGNTNQLMDSIGDYSGIIVAIGSNATRYQKLRDLMSAGASVVTLLHPAATISRHASVGTGSVVMAGVVVNAGTSVGMGAILNTACSVDHDCVLADAIHVSPGARLAGDVKVGNWSWVGIGASVRQGTVIGAKVMVGAGAAVVSHLPDDVTAMGVPARY